MINEAYDVPDKEQKLADIAFMTNEKKLELCFLYVWSDKSCITIYNSFYND